MALLDKSGFVKDFWPVEERRDHEARIFAHIGSDFENLPHIEEHSEVFYPLKDTRAAAKESSQATRETRYCKHFGENHYASNNNAPEKKEDHRANRVHYRMKFLAPIGSKLFEQEDIGELVRTLRDIVDCKILSQ
jgi:hypothetical protein